MDRSWQIHDPELNVVTLAALRRPLNRVVVVRYCRTSLETRVKYYDDILRPKLKTVCVDYLEKS